MTEDLLIAAPFGRRGQIIQTSRYRFRGWERGGDEFVIVQRTRAGEGMYFSDGVERVVGPGQAFISIVPERSEYFYPPGNRGVWEVDWINFYGKQSLRLWEDFRASFGCVVEMPGAIARAFEELIDGVSEGTDAARVGRSISSYAFLVEWAAALERTQVDDEDPIARAVRTCQTRFREPLGVKQLAAEAGMSREHFSRLFRAEVGESPGRLIRGYRIEAARELREQTDLPLKEIAMRCGFASWRQVARAMRSG